MATEFENINALIADLKNIYGNDTVGDIEKVKGISPYYEVKNGQLVENDKSLDDLYRIYVRNVSSYDETSSGRFVFFLLSKLDGKCWYQNAIPKCHVSEGTFVDEVMDYFKNYTPGLYIPQILVKTEFFNGNKHESTAIVSILKSDNTLGIYKLYYNNGVLIHTDITANYEEVKKYLELYRGL